MRQRSFKRWICPVVTVALIVAIAGPVLAEDESNQQENYYGNTVFIHGSHQKNVFCVHTS